MSEVGRLLSLQILFACDSGGLHPSITPRTAMSRKAIHHSRTTLLFEGIFIRFQNALSNQILWFRSLLELVLETVCSHVLLESLLVCLQRWGR
jgi:hypothetical protein